MSGTTRDPEGAERREVTPETVRRGAEDSLRRLGLDSVDLFQIHWPDDQGNPVEPAWQEMLKLREEGLARAVGVSNFDVALLERCEALGHVDSLQPPFNLIGRETAEELLPWADEHGTGVLCYSPMKNGILTDSFSAERVRHGRGRLAHAAPELPRAGAEPQPRAARRLAAHRRAARGDGRRRRRRLDARWPGVTAAIVGARAPEQVDGWIGAAGLELTAADLDEIAAAVRGTGAGSGPAGPRG